MNTFLLKKFKFLGVYCTISEKSSIFAPTKKFKSNKIISTKFMDKNKKKEETVLESVNYVPDWMPDNINPRKTNGRF